MLLRNLRFLDLHVYSFEFKKMWFWIKWHWQSASRKPKMAACGVNGRVIFSFNFSCNFFPRYCVIINHRKDVWYFHQKNCRRSKMMYKVQRQRFFRSDKEYCLVSYNETILNTCLWQLFTVIYQWPSNLIPSNKTFSQNTLKFMKKINENLSALNNHF